VSFDADHFVGVNKMVPLTVVATGPQGRTRAALFVAGPPRHFAHRFAHPGCQTGSVLMYFDRQGSRNVLLFPIDSPSPWFFQSTANLDLPMEKPALPTAFDHLS
jgi:hypothetical protein